MESNCLHDLLIGYGLTRNNSIVFTALIKNNTGLSAKQISQITYLARETVYKTLTNLEKKGLIEKSIEFPKKYFPIPLKTAMNILHIKKQSQMNELMALKKKVFRTSDLNSNINNLKDETEFVLVPKNKHLFNRITKAITNSQESVNIISSWKRVSKALIVYEDAITKALSNGVKFQVLVSEKIEDNKIPEDFKIFQYHDNTIVKFFEFSVKLVEIIIDDREVFLMIAPQAELLESSALWSNNKSLIAALKTCFDAVYKNNGDFGLNDVSVLPKNLLDVESYS